MATANTAKAQPTFLFIWRARQQHRNVRPAEPDQQAPPGEATDACLAEIAQDSDVLAYIESPWSRLGLAWMGAAMSVARRAPQKPDDTISQGNGKYGASVRFGPLRRQHPAPVGPEEADEKDPV